MTTVALEVVKELKSLKECGIRVSKKALAYPETHAAEMEEFSNNCMSIGEIADYVVMVTR